MLNSVVVGVGNAGGNVARMVKEIAGIPAMAINTSANDLNALGNAIPTKLFGDGRGVGKDREESKLALKPYIPDLVKDPDFIQLLSGKDIIFVVSSCGGGTGSGISLILSTILRISYPNAIIIPVGIIPLLEEGMGSQLNFVDYYDELRTKLNDMTYMLYDNNRFSDLPHNEIIEKVNERIVDDILVISGFYNTPTTLDSIDEKDMQTILSAPGRLVVAAFPDIKERDNKNGEIEQHLLADLETSAHAELQRDGRVVSSGIIMNITSRMVVNPMVPQIQKSIGVPMDTFQHISINDDRAVTNSAYLILSGLSIAKDRKDRAADKIKAINAAQKNTAVDDDDEEDLREVKNLQTKRVRVAAKKERKPAASSFDDIFKSFGM